MAGSFKDEFLYPIHRPIARRSVIASLFVAGYAAAASASFRNGKMALPENVVTDEVIVPARDGHALPAYLARPTHSGRHPALIVIHETFGIHEYIRDVCRRLARAGYVAIAPDYYDRAGDAAEMPDWESIRPIVAATPNFQVMSDSGAAVDWLLAQPFVDGSKLATIGFCWGGAMVWLLCARETRLRTGVAWYGLLAQPSYGQPPAPIDIAGSLLKPVLGLYGGEDQLIPPELVQRMRRALPGAGDAAESEIVVYARASHGFHADYRSTYDPVAAQAAWMRMMSWLARHGLEPAVGFRTALR